MIIRKRWQEFRSYLRDGTILVPLVLIFTVSIDYMTFNNMIVHIAFADTNLAMLMSALFALATNIIPFFLSIVLYVHLSLVRSEPTSDEAAAQPKNKDRVIRLSRIVVAGTFIATIITSGWVMWMRSDLMNTRAEENIRGFIAGAVTIEEGHERIEQVEKNRELLDRWFVGWRPHWQFEDAPDLFDRTLYEDGDGDGLIYRNVIFRHYDGFLIDRLLIISPLVTSLISFLLAFFYSKQINWWFGRLNKFAGMSGIGTDMKVTLRWMMDDDEESKQTQNRLWELEKFEREEREKERQKQNAKKKEIKKKIKIEISKMQQKKKDAAKDMAEARKERKKAQDDLREFKKNFDPMWEEQLSKLNTKVIEAQNEEATTKNFATPPEEKENFAKLNLMAELWAGLNCSDKDYPTKVDEFVKKYYEKVGKMAIESIENNYDANLLSIYSQVEAWLQHYKEKLSILAQHQVVKSYIDSIEIKTLINNYNTANSEATDEFKIKQWNTKEARENLKTDFKKMLNANINNVNAE